MFEFRSFTFNRRDKYNLDLYQMQSKEVSEGGGRGKGRPKGTGVFEDRLVFVGHFSHLENMVFRMMELDLEKQPFENVLDGMRDFQKDIKAFLTDIKLGMKNFEPEGKLDVSEEDEPETVEEVE